MREMNIKNGELIDEIKLEFNKKGLLVGVYVDKCFRMSANPN